jgi:hypothetical protein
MALYHGYLGVGLGRDPAIGVGTFLLKGVEGWGNTQKKRTGHCERVSSGVQLVWGSNATQNCFHESTPLAAFQYIPRFVFQPHFSHSCQ